MLLQIVKEKQPFQRLVISKEDLLRMFEHNPFKQRIISERSDTQWRERVCVSVCVCECVSV